MASTEVEAYIRRNFAENSDLTTEQLHADGLTMAEVIAMSPRMTNSIDLMEAFARTSNALRKDYGIRVRLPALPLDTPVSTVLEIFLAEFTRQQKEHVA
jgi:hypothetical protein